MRKNEKCKFLYIAQVAKVKSTVDDYVKAGNEKAVLVGWGVGGLVAKEYLRRYYNEGKVSKFVTLGTPNSGINSFGQVPQGMAVYLCVAPVINLLSKMGILDDVFKYVQIGGAGANIGLGEIVQKIVRNDATINPLNLVGLLLKRGELAGDLQKQSGFISTLNKFDPGSVGIDTSNWRI